MSDGNGASKSPEDADRELQRLWRESINARIHMLEEELTQTVKQIEALRESLAALIEP